MGNPIREVTNTDEPCHILQPWSFDDDDDSGKVLAKAGDGQALRTLRGIITEAFDVGTLAIGKTGSTSAYMAALNLVGLPVGTVFEVPGLLVEFTEDTEIIATLVGNPTTGNIDGEIGFHEEFDAAR